MGGDCTEKDVNNSSRSKNIKQMRILNSIIV